MTAPIDFVIPWVDGSDPEWAEQRSRFSDKKMDTTEMLSRFRDWNNLQYWFRGAEKFAPWVNKIHLISWGHLPPWLNTAHPKLNIVRHSDYIPEKYLPTFSSHPIELNIHRIKDLAEHFVYFNDDMFIIRPVEQELFFKNGLPCDQARLDYITSQERDMFPHILINNIDLINRNFPKRAVISANKSKWYNPAYGLEGILRNLLLSWTHNFSGIKWQHIPQAFLKSSFEAVWEQEYDVLDQTSSRKFRDYLDVSQYAIRYWQLAKGNFHPINMNKSGRVFHLPADFSELMSAIRMQSMPMVCVNDTEKCDNFEELRDSVIEAFEQILPAKSDFEI